MGSMGRGMVKINAYELANELAFKHIDGDDSGDYRVKLQDMLRQQAERIEFLENGYFQAWKLLNNGMIELASNARKIIQEAENK